MSEQNPPYNRRESYTLGRGFSVLRLAVGEALERMATDLEAVRAQDNELEIRHPDPGARARRRGDRRPGVQLVSGLDIRSLNVVDPGVPLANVYDEIDRTVPSLGLPLENVTLTEAYDVEIPRGLFFVTALDDRSADTLKNERAQVLRTALRVGGVIHPRKFNMPEPDMTIGFLGDDAARDTLDAAYEIIDGHLPMEVTLLPAIRHPRDVE